MKNRLSRALILVLVGCGLAGLAPAACPKNFDPFKLNDPAKSDADLSKMKYPDLPRYLRDDQLGVTLSLPEGWSISKRAENPLLLATSPDAGLNGPLINLVIEDLGNRMNPYDYLSANIITLQASVPGLVIKKWAVEAIEQKTVAWIHYSYPLGGEQIEAVAYCQTDDFKAYVVTGVAPAKTFSMYEPTLRAIGRSLAIE